MPACQWYQKAQMHTVAPQLVVLLHFQDMHRDHITSTIVRMRTTMEHAMYLSRFQITVFANKKDFLFFADEKHDDLLRSQWFTFDSLAL